MRQHSWKAFALVIAGIMLSVLLAAILEGATGVATPGGFFIEYFVPTDTGMDYFGRRLLIALGIDSALCFAAMVGLYKLRSRLQKGAQR